MRLDQELLKRNMCESRTEAQELIAGGFVFVDGVLCLKQTKQVTLLSRIEVTKRRDFVSRGGEKLRGALTHVFGNDALIRQFCKNAKVLDVGSSTGGFTDCLLGYGVENVDAVDVGTSQLHNKLKEDSRVTSYENTDIRNFISKIHYDIIVADLSFIRLEQVLPSIVSFAKKETSFLLLLKPQFEVGKGNTKKGIVKDSFLVDEILQKYTEELEKIGITSVKISPCTLRGGDGNQEYFLYGKLA